MKNLEEGVEKATKNVKESVEELYEILSHIAESVIVISSEKKIQYVNDKAKEIFGDDLAGAFCYERIMNKDLPCTDCSLNSIDTNKNIEFRKEIEYIDPATQDKRFLEIASNFTTRFKGKPAVIDIIRDITESKQVEDALRESESFLKKAQEIAHIGHWKLNPKTLEVSGSDELFKIFGLTHEEATLDAFANVVHPEDREYDLSHINRGIEYGENWDIEYRLISKDGTEKWVQAIGEAIKDESGKVILVLGTVQDITERKKIEKESKKSEENFRKAFNQTNFYKDLFAHDMSNILNAINGSVQLYSLYQDDNRKRDERNTLINIIKDQVMKGILLVNNVRLLTELEENAEVFIIGMEVLQVLKTTIKFIEESFQERRVEISIECTIKKPSVMANELLSDVFTNILTNAVKYNDKPIVEVLIKISKEQKKPKTYIKFEFIDNGIGVKDANKNYIFQKGHEVVKGVKGMGFGLTLVVKLLESYEGVIWVENKVKDDYSQGSNFVILIPESP